MAKHRLLTTFNYNEKRVLFVLVLLLGGDQAFAFQASSKGLALDLSRHHSHLQCEYNNLSIRERQKGHYQVVSIARASLCIHRNHATSARWGATSSRNKHDNFALSMSQNQNDGNNDDTTMQSASETELRREFDRLDIDKSGAIDKAELTYFIQFVPKAIIDKIYSLADTNNDGVIDFDEYKSIRRAMGVSPRLRLDDLLNIPIVELANLSGILLCSFLVAVSTLNNLPQIPLGEYDTIRSILRDGLHLTLTRDGNSIEARALINATLYFFNYIFAIDFFVRWFASAKFNPQYLLKPLVVLDIVVVLIPLSVQSIYPFLSVANSPGLQNLLLLRILRLQRVLSDIDTFSRFEMALGLPPESVRPFQLQLARVLLSLFTLLSVSSGLIYTTEHGVNPEIPDYFSALYFGLTTLTTVGFGDITPVTPQGRLVVCASILAGVAVIPAQAASLLDAILEYQNEGKLKQSSLAEAEINVSQISPRVSDETKTKVVSPSKEQDKSTKEVRSIEETVSMLLTSISQLEQSGDSSVEEIEDIRESIADYVKLREGLETSLENILKKVNMK
mmetsp:Transcript_6328/g.15743  ORF Transcript_6328/g.15743 Transcript_6328/m.15743 type:complete len:562 (-) Transcript_6328:326-2011(-)|eukprot:CAMPEP_0181124014 /NCGR_PEP_ID=MMETSP1071-20121207/26235_1 /TAXON_ID=35127 /ORGANISM="Thalassiosira sp., Strain NH16" /LENGTH=561 /DNA_ID=CAMNT_0023209251 /DNA_START=203 /DNA_END=1891 /DNA_ORIENTATION=-